VQTRLREFVESGQLGLFKNGYWDNPAYKLPPEADLMAVTHYLEALDLQKEIVKIHTIFGGKNPHPNWLVGGVPCPINVHSTGAVGAINMERLNHVSSILSNAIEFTTTSISRTSSPSAASTATGCMAAGCRARRAEPMATSPSGPMTIRPPTSPAAGAIINGDLSTVHEVDVRDPEQIQEFVDHSWYEYGEPGMGLHPWDGVTQPNFELGPNTVGSRTNIREIDEAAKYSWIKAPRWRGNAMEVGPLARYIVGYASGHERITDQVTGLLRTMDLPVDALFSTLGRTAARALEAQYCAELQQYFFDKLMTNIIAGDESTANVERWDPSSWPASTRGVGFTEAPRGALGHWVTIRRAGSRTTSAWFRPPGTAAPATARAISGPSRRRF
jgi:hydrogenase large subunit